MKTYNFEIENFSARKISSGCYRVSYNNIETYELWTYDVNIMPLIDATFGAEEIDMEEWAHLYELVTEKGDYYNGNEDLDEDDEDE